MRKEATLAFAMAILAGCGGNGETDSACMAPLPATNSCGNPWPSYSEKLAELGRFQRDIGYTVEDQSCSDGKHVLFVANGFSGNRYYYRGATQVGLQSTGDAVFIFPNGCTSDAPRGTHESVSCRVVSRKAIDGPALTDAGQGCEFGTHRCSDRILQTCEQTCTEEGSAWVTLEVCFSADLCDPSGCIPPSTHQTDAG